MTTFFNVPNAPGVPPMARKALSAVSTVQGISAAIQNTIQFFQGQSPLPVWGIFDSNNTSVLTVDSILNFSNSKKANIPNFAKQGGKLVVYDKVQLPFDNMVRVSRSGALTDRQAFLRQLDILQESLDTFTIVTPEKSYLNVNCHSYDIVRDGPDGANWLTDVNLFFQEVPVATAVYVTTAGAPDTSNAAQPGAQGVTNQGQQLPATPSNNAQNQVNIVNAGGSP